MAPRDEAPSAGEPASPDDRSGQSSDRGATADGEPPAGDEPTATAGPDEEAAGPTTGPGGRREVEVPGSLYRIVTVFSTLLSVLLVVLGASVLDMATTVLSNPPVSLVVRLLALAGVPMGTLTANSSVLALAVGLFGLALVAAGAGVYVFGSRFRAPGMGKPKDEADEASDDG